MKKLFIVFCFLIVAMPVLACDICGAGTGSSYMGLLPEFKRRFVGVRYQYSHLRNHLGENGSTTYLTAAERYHTAEIWGAVNLGSKLRLSAFIPYHFISREKAEGKQQANGMGDVSVIGYYQAFSRQQERKSGTLAQSLWIGAGVKLPTGRYNPEDHNIQQSGINTFQLGTGSTDFSLHAMYDISYKNAGLNINGGYKINTRNKEDYQYGNKLTLNTLAYYRITRPAGWMITPNTGLLWEAARKDYKAEDVQVWETGGHSLMYVAGTEVTRGAYSAGINFQLPVTQHLGEGKAAAGSRLMAHISYSF